MLVHSKVRTPYEDTFVSWSVPPRLMDQLWSGAWWFLGTTFFRQSMIAWRGSPAELLHLRIVLGRYFPSHSQRRILRRNRDLEVTIRLPIIDDERRELFNRHKCRFMEGIPDSLDDFLGPMPGVHPVSGLEFDLCHEGRLVAASYVARGENSMASLYGIFDPEQSDRSLGIFTMLLEIAHARQCGMRYYYPGYALAEPSCMDYKKRFWGLEAYSWDQGWRPFQRQLGTGESSRPSTESTGEEIFVPILGSEVAD